MVVEIDGLLVAAWRQWRQWQCAKFNMLQLLEILQLRINRFYPIFLVSIFGKTANIFGDDCVSITTGLPEVLAKLAKFEVWASAAKIAKR